MAEREAPDTLDPMEATAAAGLGGGMPPQTIPGSPVNAPTGDLGAGMGGAGSVATPTGGVTGGDATPAKMPDIFSLINSGNLDPAVTAGLADIQRKKVAAEAAVGDTTERDRRRVEQAYAAERFNPDELPKWNADAESAKRTTDPIVAFGSIGSVFGIIASAFTHAPMENALNASAAAMNAIKAGDKESYTRAYDAWQKNTELTLKRHQIQHEAYQDAIQLMGVNMQASQAKLKTLATQFGDRKTLFLLEHGFDKELQDMLMARQKSATELASVWPKIQLDNTKYQDLISDPRFGDVKTRAEAINEWSKRWDPGRAEAERHNRETESIMRGRIESTERTAEKRIKSAEEIAAERNETAKEIAAMRQTPDQMFAQKLFKNNPDMTDEEFANKFGDYKKKQKAAVLSESKTWAGQKATRLKQLNEQTGPGHEAENAQKVQREFMAPASPNRLDDLASRIDQYDNSAVVMKRSLGILDKHVLAAGLGGKATRLGERVSNILGSNETDRVQFMRDIEYLRLEAPRLLLDSHGRPLSAEAGHINNIIAGLSAGDTTANTIRSLEEIQSLYNKMKADAIARWRGEWTPRETGGAPPAGPTPPGSPPTRAPGGGNWWQQVPDKVLQ